MNNTTATTTSAASTAAPAVKPLPSIPDYGENAIEITNLTFSYRATDSSSSYTNTSTNNPENVVLQDMNLSLPTGSRCLLIGANGSGKSVRSACCCCWLCEGPLSSSRKMCNACVFTHCHLHLTPTVIFTYHITTRIHTRTDTVAYIGRTAFDQKCPGTSHDQ
jgi:hypothetical protein